MTIDWWTLGIQAVNVAILIWLLGRFFWKPLSAMIAERRAVAARSLDDAKAKRDEATRALEEIERTRAGFAKERDQMLADAHAAAERDRTARLAETAKEIAAREAAAQALIDKQAAEVEERWTDRAARLAVEIASRLLARLDGAAAQGAFFDWLVKEIRELPTPARQSLAVAGIALEAVSAGPLPPAEQERWRAGLTKLLGIEPQLRFRTDPALIAGLELHAPHLVIQNSWRADLDRILKDLTHDHQH
ncbi:MAG TPA: F0F1 ATP synthase subunit delta [Aliidongia sp.]|nr:F0F1 ATP synthase subunit delta [Aliidongia sp.]